VMSIWRSPKPVIAQVHGWCLGAGTAPRRPQRFGDFRVLSAVLGPKEYRGERFRLAFVSHLSALCGRFAVFQTA
jgi:hypothetical protein